MNRRERVLVVCTGNICRSPFAEGLLRNMVPGLLVQSAGTHAVRGNSAPLPALRVAREFGVDLTSHRAKRVTGRLVARFDRVLAMELEHLAWMEEMMEQAGTEPTADVLGIRDPFGGEIEHYRACYEGIEAALRGLV